MSYLMTVSRTCYLSAADHSLRRFTQLGLHPNLTRQTLRSVIYRSGSGFIWVGSLWPMHGRRHTHAHWTRKLCLQPRVKYQPINYLFAIWMDKHIRKL